MFKLHLNSGIAETPNDPTLLHQLQDHNNKLDKYPVPRMEKVDTFGGME
jgi:hypothetical protein